MANQLASSYSPDFSEADPPKPWGMESPNNNLALSILQKDIDQRAAATRVAYKGGASPTDYVQTAGYIGKHLIDQAVDSIKSGVTLPHDVAQGDVDPLSPDGIRRTLDLAGLMAGGGLAEKAETGKLGSGAIRPAPKGEAVAANEPFYSAIDRVVAAGPGKASGPQWAATIKNAPGVKQEEIDWLGLNDMLAKHEGPVSKEQLQDYIDQHKVQLGETWKQGYKNIDDVDPDEDSLYALDGPDTPKYADYATPGAENYRELLLRMPTEKGGAPKVIPKDGKFYLEWPSGESVVSETTKTPVYYYSEGDANRAARSYGRTDQGGYVSSHWDEPNVLGHLRMSDRWLDAPSPETVGQIEAKMEKGLGINPSHMASGTPVKAVKEGIITPDEAAIWSKANRMRNQFSDDPSLADPKGKKSLFLEELQSDWHQAGRRVYTDKIKELMEDYGLSKKEAQEKIDESIGYQRQSLGGNGPPEPKLVPDAPFKKTWPDLLLKRAVREAVDNGYDSISWTSGATQADRYDLSKQVNQILAWKNKDGTFRVTADPQGASQRIVLGENLPAEKLSDAVGKDLAEKITGIKEVGGPATIFKGGDLKVGGEGMKAFYDKELPARAKKLFKLEVTSQKIGGQGSPVYGSYVEPETVHVMKLTPEFKKQVREKGFPLFSAGAPVPGGADDDQNLPASGSGAILRPGALRLVPVDHDPFARGGR